MLPLPLLLRCLVDRPPGRLIEEPLLYRDGRTALAAATEAVRKYSHASEITVWVPDYICNEGLEGIRGLPKRLQFYPVMEDLTPDWSWLEGAVTHGEAHAFVLVDYFGFPGPVLQARRFCDTWGMVLIEDAAHVTAHIHQAGEGDLTIYSPRKTLGLPSGGVLVGRHPALGCAPSTSVAGRRTRWVVKALALHGMVRANVPWHMRWALELPEPGPGSQRALQRRAEFSGLDALSRALLLRISDRIAGMIQARRYNYQRLIDVLPEEVALPLFRELPVGVAPYAFPLVVAGDARPLVRHLRARGVPAGLWPDLPPEVFCDVGVHGRALDLGQRVVLLPVHQSLEERHLRHIARGLETFLGRAQVVGEV